MTAVARPAMDRRVPRIGFLVGLADCLALYAAIKVTTVANVELGDSMKLAIGLGLFGGIGVVVGVMARRFGTPPIWHTVAGGFAASLAGIAAAVLVWMALEETVFRRLGAYPLYEERTLFPVDVLMLWVFGSVPILAGLGLGLLVARR
jgi:hypothetical protein